MGSFNEMYSNFGFFQALCADVYSAAATGDTLDLRGYGTVAIGVLINSYASAGADAATNNWIFTLQHGLPSALGVSAWSLVPLSQIIHSVEGGYASTASDGVFQLIGSRSDAVFADAAGGSGFFFVGYKQDTTHRYLRLYVSVLSVPSAAWMGAFAVVGNAGIWPVNDPIDNV